jgi:hypothetical protein
MYRRNPLNNATSNLLSKLSVPELLSSKAPASVAAPKPNIKHLVGVTLSSSRAAASRHTRTGVALPDGADTPLMHIGAAASGMRPTSWARTSVEHLPGSSGTRRSVVAMATGEQPPEDGTTSMMSTRLIMGVVGAGDPAARAVTGLTVTMLQMAATSPNLAANTSIFVV